MVHPLEVQHRNVLVIAAITTQSQKDLLELISRTIWICKGMNRTNPNHTREMILALIAEKTHLTEDGWPCPDHVNSSVFGGLKSVELVRKHKNWADGEIFGRLLYTGISRMLWQPKERPSPRSTWANLRMRDTEKCSMGGEIKGTFEEERRVHEGTHENPLLGAIRLRFTLFYAEGAKSRLLSESFKCMTVFNSRQQRLKKGKK